MCFISGEVPLIVSVTHCWSFEEVQCAPGLLLPMLPWQFSLHSPVPVMRPNQGDWAPVVASDSFNLVGLDPLSCSFLLSSLFFPFFFIFCPSLLHSAFSYLFFSLSFDPLFLMSFSTFISQTLFFFLSLSLPLSLSLCLAKWHVTD